MTIPNAVHSATWPSSPLLTDCHIGSTGDLYYRTPESAAASLWNKELHRLNIRGNSKHGTGNSTLTVICFTSLKFGHSAQWPLTWLRSPLWPKFGQVFRSSPKPAHYMYTPNRLCAGMIRYDRMRHNFRVDYTYEVVNEYIIAMINLDQGNRSLTNDMENVMADIQLELGHDLSGFAIVYKDSRGYGDGMKLTPGG